MALSGGPYIQNFYSGNGYSIIIEWTATQNIASNQSTVTAKMYLRSNGPGYIIRSSNNNKNGRITIDGVNYNFTFNPTVNGNQKKQIGSATRTITHNASGSRSFSIGGYATVAISLSQGYVGTVTVSSRTETLNTIHRGSTLSAFSFASSLQIGTKNTINYTVTKHSGNFRHQFQLRDGSVTVAQWDNVDANGSSSLELTGAQVDTILGRMSTVTSKTFTLRLSTRSGHNGGWIGSSVTRDATVSVNANVEPTISSTSATPIGNSWAVGKGFYVQGQTGVQAEFSGTARGGAGIKSRNISIGSLSNGGSEVGSVFRHSQSRVNTSGDITITYKITDTRNRTVSSTRKINFRAYTPPQITSFTVGRPDPSSSTVTIKSKGSIHGIGGQNTGTMTVKQQGVTSPVRSQSLNNTTPSFDDSFNREVATSSSADFTLTVTDLLGNSATSTSTAGTAFMELSIRKGTGVGIGKVHEQGALDVNGAFYLNGKEFGSSTAWGDITGKPSTFTPSSHTHAYQQTSRTANGQTGTINNATWTRVSYGKTFPSTPGVVATGVSNVAGDSFAKIRNRDTTGFEIIVGGVGTSNVFNWIAIVTG